MNNNSVDTAQNVEGAGEWFTAGLYKTNVGRTVYGTWGPLLDGFEWWVMYTDEQDGYHYPMGVVDCCDNHSGLVSTLEEAKHAVLDSMKEMGCFDYPPVVRDYWSSEPGFEFYPGDPS